MTSHARIIRTHVHSMMPHFAIFHIVFSQPNLRRCYSHWIATLLKNQSLYLHYGLSYLPLPSPKPPHCTEGCRSVADTYMYPSILIQLWCWKSSPQAPVSDDLFVCKSVSVGARVGAGAGSRYKHWKFACCTKAYMCMRMWWDQIHAELGASAARLQTQFSSGRSRAG